MMVAKVSSLLKTVKNVEEEAGRGVRSLENSIDSIEADIAEFDSLNPPKEPATPEDLIRSTKVSTQTFELTVLCRSCNWIAS